MDNLIWVFPVLLGLFAVLRKSGGLKRGVESFRQQILEAQQAAQAAQGAAPRTPQPAAALPPPSQRAMRRPVPAPAPSVVLPAAAARTGPAPEGRSVLAAFADPSHARTAVILAEILAPPVALR